MKKILTTCLSFLVTEICFSQDQIEMADELRSSGKIYIVVGCLVTILLGVLLFLIFIDKKVGNLEKKINKK